MDHDLINARLKAIGSVAGTQGASREAVYEEWALPLLSAWPKVLNVLDGGIPDPEVVELFPTNHCNLKCPHCRFRDQHGERSEHIALTTLEALLRELKTRGVSRLELSGGGESLDHPDAVAMFTMFRDMGFRVGLITNAFSLVDDLKLTDAVLACTDWIRVSVDAFTDATYSRVHGKPDHRYSALRELIGNMTARAADTPRIGLKMLVSKLNADDAEIAIPAGLELGADYMQFKFLGFPHELALADEEQQAISNTLSKHIAEYRDATMKVEFVPPYTGEQTRERCMMTFLHPVIDWDGSIYLCAFFEHRKHQHSIGNIEDGGFFRHWDDEKHREVFNGIDPLTCLPNCPMRRYNPVIEFIVRNDYRKGYI